MEKISVDCPNCNSTLKAPPEFAGKVATCPDCGTKVRVPIGPSTPQGSPPPGPPKRTPPSATPVAGADDFGVDTEASGDPFAAAPAGPPGRARRKKTPSVDPKFIAIGIAAVVLVAGVIWFLTKSSGAGAAMNYMPDGTAVIGVVHYADMMDSKFVKTARDKFPQVKKSKEQYTQAFGDLAKKVDRITFGGSPDNNEVLIYVELSSATTVKEIREEIGKAKVKKIKTVGSYKIYAERDGKGSDGFCLLDSRTALIGKVKLIEDVLKRNGKPKLAKGMKAALAKADMSQSMCFVMSLKAMKSGPGRGMPGGKAAQEAMKKAEAVVIGVDVGSDLDFDVTVICDDSDDAKDIKEKAEEGIEKMQGLAQLMLGKAGKEAMEGISVKNSGSNVSIVGSISVDTIEKIAEKLKKGGGGLPFGS